MASFDVEDCWAILIEGFAKPGLSYVVMPLESYAQVWKFMHANTCSLPCIRATKTPMFDTIYAVLFSSYYLIANSTNQL